MDLSAMDNDSPVLWIRLDPDMTLVRCCNIEQPDYQWQYQLRHERDVTAQFEAIMALERYSTPATRMALTDTIENEQTYVKVRCAAAHCLTKVANSMVSNWAGPPAMLAIFRKLFGSFSCPHIIKQNNFTNLQHYYLQKTIPVAMAGLRNIHGICPPEVIKFLLDLFKYNDNSKNKFSDNYYRAALIEALGETITPVIYVAQHGTEITVDSLSADTKLVLEEITRHLNLEKFLPCYKLTISVACLKSIRKLQKFGHLPSTPHVFKTYTQYGLFIDLRLCALEALVDYTVVDGTTEDLEFLLKIAEEDPDPSVRYALVRMLCENPPFHRRPGRHRLDNEDLVHRLWKLMNCMLSHDTKMRCSFVDLYFTLYGKKRPLCLPASAAASTSRSKSPNFEERGEGLFTNGSSLKRKATSPPLSLRDTGIVNDELGVVTVEVIAKEETKRIKTEKGLKSDYFSDNSASLPGMGGSLGPIGFEPGMFKKEESVKSESSSNKSKKKKKDKKKHKHKHKHKHDHKHSKDKAKEKSKDKGRDKDKEKHRDRDKHRDKDRDKEKERDKDKDRERIKEREREREKLKEREKEALKVKVKEETLSSDSSTQSPIPSTSNIFM